ncbi:glycine betaine ABC transporter substrate-binding protein [Commensalibacter oyaizuii]|uniref:Glycine betaine ABC transporter substrate-binding protein n=1 Tax=Commensalibacter oyaizuii TaxID=3043873 RepID=A0ABT6Q1N7_9PROT|nr:glycine betaine ABC transporter substrate-binding protein [Commensalibacter sp. TBRC 16381]MDI2091022.1 glycine betaine ABC transporter substrate-binding protein [Commensalibacter sp. TBRC 16381]
MKSISIKSLKLGFFDTVLHEATAAAVLRVLEAHDIFDIEFITGEKAALIQELKAGEIDIFTTLWLPDVHNSLINDFPLMKSIGTLYHPTLFFALPVQFQSEISSIDHLKSVDSIHRNVEVPATLYEKVQEIFVAYGLLESGYSLIPVADEAAFKRYQQILQSQEGKIIIGYHPSFLDDDQRLYSLQDPKAMVNSEQRATILIRDRIVSVLGSDLIDELAEMTLGNQVVKLMEHAVRVNGMDAHEAAEEWQRGKLVVRA